MRISKVAHKYQLVFDVQSNSVRILQLCVASCNRPQPFLVTRGLLAVNDHGVLVLDGHKHFLLFFIDRDAEGTVRSRQISRWRSIPASVSRKDRQPVLRVVVEDVHFLVTGSMYTPHIISACVLVPEMMRFGSVRRA